jgi:hypothetical protein
MLERNIKKALLEMKEKKENLLIEEKIIKNRFLMIVENTDNIKNFKKLPIRKREKISFALLEDFISLQRNGLISEDFDFLSVLKDLFGGLLGRSTVETIAEPILNKILTSVGFVSDGILKKTMISFLTSRPSDLANAFTDCNSMVKLLVESFVEGLVMLLQGQVDKTGFLSNYIRNVLGGKIKESDVAKSFENAISEKVCNLFSSFTDKAQDIKNKLMSSSTPDSTAKNDIMNVLGGN